jgi:DnaJ-class molecular chaperone
MKLYDTLGLTKDASKNDIRKAYKSLAVKYHPDKNKDDPDASNKFKEVSSAYETLYNDTKRRIYDMTGDITDDMNDMNNMNDAGAYDIFNSLFNSFSGKNDMYTNSTNEGFSNIFDTINSSLNGASGGVKFTIHTFGNMPSPDILQFNTDNINMLKDACKSNLFNILNGGKMNFDNITEDNTANDNSHSKKNKHHHNSKYKKHDITKEYSEPKSKQKSSKNDIICNCMINIEDVFNNVTKTLQIKRKRYYGKKSIDEEKLLKIQLTEQNIIFEGEGDESYKSKSFGDIIIKLNDKPHNNFKRINTYDLVYEKTLSLYEYYAGTKFTFTHLDKRNITVKINKNELLRTYNNYLKIYGEGLPNKSGSRGDLFIKINIKLPQLSDKNIKKIKKYFKPNIEENISTSSTQDNSSTNNQNTENTQPEINSDVCIELAECTKMDFEMH